MGVVSRRGREGSVGASEHIVVDFDVQLAMGKGRDKRKKAKGSVPGGGTAKTERKTQKNEEKAQRRAQRGGEEDDIDAILASFHLQEKSKLAVRVDEGVPPPSRRVNCSFTSVEDGKKSELILFGGEHYDGKKIQVFGDLFKYHPEKDQWSSISSPNSPPPRSAHQAVLCKEHLYVFGGEFTSPNQEKFHHFKDLWRLNLQDSSWEQLPSKGGPSARSGHRMICYKKHLVLFGGFYDTGSDIKYYNDLWIYNTEDLKWTSVGKASSGPSPRSGCQLVAKDDTVYLYGGYFKSRDEEDSDLPVEKGTVLHDMWTLSMKDYSWRKVKKAGFAPGPRAGFSMAGHLKKAVLFGGVSDHEARGGEVLISEFYNEAYTFTYDNERWYPLSLRIKGTKKKEVDTARHGDAQAREDASREALNRAATRIQAVFRGHLVRKAYRLYKIGGVVSELLYSPAEEGVVPSRDVPKPRGRINAAMCVLGNDLYLFSGMVELGDKEVTFDDFWKLNLKALDGWKCLQAGTVLDSDLQPDLSSEDDEDSP